MFRYFRISRPIIDMFLNPSDEVSTSLANVATIALPDKTGRHFMLVGKKSATFVGIKNNTKFVISRQDVIN